tara:strand:+ start:3798 stop:4892 length:1095 start_codon:yes stop_codon:yes gene_type:complete
MSRRAFQQAWGLVKRDFASDMPKPYARTKQIRPSAHEMGEIMTPEEIASLRVFPKFPKGKEIVPFNEMIPGANQAELFRTAHEILGGNPNYNLNQIVDRGPWMYSAKMPGPGSAIPTHFCRKGGKLRQGSETTCSDCNVHQRGNFAHKDAREKMYRQYRNLGEDTDRFASAASFLMPHHAKRHASPLLDMKPNFRHHVSGDIQNVDHLRMINELARYNPDIQHWLPTLERQDVARFMRDGDESLAPNLRMSISAPYKNQTPEDYELESLMKYPQLGHPNIEYSGVGVGRPESFCPGVCVDEGCNECFVPSKLDKRNKVWMPKLRGGRKGMQLNVLGQKDRTEEIKDQRRSGPFAEVWNALYGSN